MNERQKPDINIFIVFITAAALRAMCYLQPVVFRFRNDDFGPLTYAAYLAGFDWRNYTSGINDYYGFGYYWIFAPLMRFLNSPKLILLAITAVNSLVMVLSCVLIYKLLVKYFGFPQKLYTVVFALLPAMFQGDPKGGRYWYRTDNEIPLYLVCWLIVLVLLKASENIDAGAKARITLAACTSVILCWGLSVHERTMALLLGIVIAEILLFLAKRKWLLHPGAFFPTLAAGYFLQRLLRKHIISVMWLGGMPEKNTSSFSRVSLWFMESFTAVKALLMVFIGNFHKLMIRGFGLPAIALVVVTVWVIKQLPVLRKKYFSEDEEVRSAWIAPDMLIMLVFGLSILITIAGIAVRWGILLYPGLQNNEVVYGYKGICYVRYYFTFMGPLIMASAAYIKRNMPLKTWIAAGTGLVLLCIEAVFFGWIYPLCVSADAKAGTAYARRALGMYIIPDCPLGPGMAVSLLLMAAVMICILSASLYRRDQRLRKSLLLAGVTIALCAFIAGRAAEMDPLNTSLSFGSSETVTDIISGLRKSGELADNIYLEYDNRNFSVIFINKDLNYHIGDPDGEEALKSSLSVRRKKKTGYYKKLGYKGVRIDGFCFYTNDAKTKKALKRMRKELGKS